ncbi:MAG: hypothetical protein COB23_03150 [Methylophaga sp.]|nr:MAG: hypothetical protein COB23_03150 [Methylophaga sp.]
MCGGKKPKVQPLPPPPPEPVTQVDADVQGVRGREKKRQRAAAGRSSTILTGGQGLESQAATGKTILGG